MLATVSQEHPSTWETHLPKVCLAYNTSVQASTGYTPFYLMFGREARLPVDIMCGSSPTERTSPNHYATQLRDSVCQAFNKVCENLSSSHNRQKECYDKRIHGRSFDVGDLVWLHSNAVPRGQSRKFFCPWNGPHRVIQKLAECTYQIQDLQRNNRTQIVHFNRLKLCAPDTRWDTPHAISTPDRAPIGQNMEVDVSADDTVITPPLPSCRYPLRERRPPDRFTDAIYV